MTPLDTIREMHVLYGIAATRRWDAEPIDAGAYRKMAKDLHTAMLADDPVVMATWAARQWEAAATIAEYPADSLYAVWAKNLFRRVA